MTAASSTSAAASCTAVSPAAGRKACRPSGVAAHSSFASRSRAAPEPGGERLPAGVIPLAARSRGERELERTGVVTTAVLENRGDHRRVTSDAACRLEPGDIGDGTRTLRGAHRLGRAAGEHQQPGVGGQHLCKRARWPAGLEDGQGERREVIGFEEAAAQGESSQQRERLRDQLGARLQTSHRQAAPRL